MACWLRNVDGQLLFSTTVVRNGRARTGRRSKIESTSTAVRLENAATIRLLTDTSGAVDYSCHPRSSLREAVSNFHAVITANELRPSSSWTIHPVRIDIHRTRGFRRVNGLQLRYGTTLCPKIGLHQTHSVSGVRKKTQTKM